MTQFTTRRGTIVETTSIVVDIEQSRSAVPRRTRTTVELTGQTGESQSLIAALSRSSDFSLFDEFNLAIPPSAA
jgi:hypothetical protein